MPIYTRGCCFEMVRHVCEEGLSLAAVHRICKKAGAERVSESASLELAKALEEVGVRIGNETLQCMMRAERETLKARDIEIAAKEMFGSPRF